MFDKEGNGFIATQGTEDMTEQEITQLFRFDGGYNNYWGCSFI